MGHRAIVAYGGEDGRYDLYYAHWGAADLALAGRLSTPETDPVAPDPLAVAVPFTAVVREYADPLVHEALYIVDPTGVRTYRGLWFGPVGVDGGLLVAVDPAAACDDARVRAWFQGARAFAADCHERGHLPAETAATLLEVLLRDWAGDREVLRCPGD